MLETDILTLISSLGVGGIVSYLILNWKRQDDKTWLEEKEQHRQDLKLIIERQEVLQQKTLEALIANTQAISAINRTVNDLASLEVIKQRLDTFEKIIGQK